MTATAEYIARGSEAGVQLELAVDEDIEKLDSGIWEDNPLEMKVARGGKWGSILLSSDQLHIVRDDLYSTMLYYNKQMKAREIVINGRTLSNYKCINVPDGGCELELDKRLSLLLSMKQLSDGELATAYGMHVKRGAWHGASIFKPKYSYKIFVTKGVAKNIATLRYPCLCLTPAEEYGLDIAISHATARIARGMNTNAGMPQIG